MLIASLAVLVSALALAWSAERFVFGAAAAARVARVPPLVVGMIVVGFGTSAPELLISAFAAVRGNSGLAIGNALGSNIVNTGLIVGLTALVAPLAITAGTVRRELPLLCGCVLLAFGLSLDGWLGRADGLVLCLTLCAVVAWLARAAHRARGVAAPQVPAAVAPAQAIAWLAVGLAVLLLSARTLVWGAVTIADALGVSDLVIGLTIVALGTSLPELAASLASVLKREHDIALGNVIGSNIFNVLGVFGLPGLLNPAPIADGVLGRDFPTVLALSAGLLAAAYARHGRAGRIDRLEGGFLLAAFAAYQWVLLVSAG